MKPWLLIALSMPSWAASTRYVMQSCTNNGDGTAGSCAASPGGVGAYKGFSNVSWSTVGAGGTLNLVSGETFTTGFTVSSSGTAGNPLTITVSGGGTATIDGTGLTGALMNFGGQTYVTINGVSGQATTGNTTYGLRVININNGVGVNTYCAYENNGGGHLKLLHVECSGSATTDQADDNAGVYLQVTSVGDTEVGYNWMHGPNSASKWHATCQSLFASTGTASFTDGGISHDNQCENMYNDGLRGTSNYSAYNNVIKHIDGSGHSDSLLCQSGNYCALFNNYIEGSGDQNIYIDNLLNSTVAHYRIYNNIINSDPGFGIALDPEGGGSSVIDDLVVANNTFYKTSAASIRWSRRGTLTNVALLNNIYGTNSDVSYDLLDLGSGGVSLAGATSWDYDLFSTSAVNYPTVVNFGGSNITLAQTQALSPTREAHGGVGIPTYIDTSNANFKISASDTVAKATGVDLTSTYSWLTVDKAGVTRPNGSAWTLGAYQFTSGGGSSSLGASKMLGASVALP